MVPSGTNFDKAIQHKAIFFASTLSVSRRLVECVPFVCGHWVFGFLACQPFKYINSIASETNRTSLEPYTVLEVPV